MCIDIIFVNIYTSWYYARTMDFRFSLCWQFVHFVVFLEQLEITLVNRIPSSTLNMTIANSWLTTA